MRQGPFELLILRSDGTPIAEHELDGKRYIAAEPNTEYQVKVVVHPDKSGKLPYPLQRMSLSIDGRVVNYTYLLGASQKAATFVGFRKDMDAYQAFMFSLPAVGDTQHNTVRADSVGSIQMTVYEASQSTAQSVPVFPPPPDCVRAGEGKKFWQQPSLQTAGGRILPAVKPTMQFVYSNIRTVPDATLEVFYHTTDMVNFLRSLNKQQNTLTSHVIAPPLHVDLSTQEVASPVRAPAETVDLTQPAGRAKVKREYKGGTRARAAKKPRTAKGGGGASDVVDLT